MKTGPFLYLEVYPILSLITHELTWEKESQHIVGRKVENIKILRFNEQNVHKKIISADNLSLQYDLLLKANIKGTFCFTRSIAARK